MWVRGLIVALVGCTHVEVVPPLTPTRLDETMDPGEGGVMLEHDARRHEAPVGMMRRRVYAVDTSVVRWYPRSLQRPRSNRFVVLPSLPAVPADRVALRGSPPPMPGQRFVLFDDRGPRSVVEVTGEQCPPGHEGCIVCAADDPARRHWTRIVGAMPTVPVDNLLALGPFAAGEALPVPRALDEMTDIVRGRWRLGAFIDLDGDGAADSAWASPARACRAAGCPPSEAWRMVAGRWYAEPLVVQPEVPFRLLAAQVWETGVKPAHAVGDIPGAPWVSLRRRESEAHEPRPGDYWVMTGRGVVGSVHYTGVHIQTCGSDGAACHEAQVIAGSEEISGGLAAGPIPPGVALRSVALPLSLERAPGWWPDVARPEVVLDLDDGRRWTVTSRPCAMVTTTEQTGGVCFEGREDRQGAAPLRWMSGAFAFGHHSRTEPVCRRIDDSTMPPAK